MAGRGPYDPDLSRLCLFVAASGSGRPLDMVAGFVERVLSRLAGRGWGAPLRAEVIHSLEGEKASLDGCGYLLVVLATGGTEPAAVSLARRAARSRVPTLIVSHPHANSLPSLLEAKAAWPAAAYRHLPDLASRGEALLEAWIRGLWAAYKASRARVGLVGEPSPWLVYSLPGGESRIGAVTVRIEARSILEEAGRARLGPEDEERARRLVEGAEGAELAEGEPWKSMRVYKALKALMERYSLDAVTPACWWFYRDTGANACLAHALLNSEGAVVGCEGDVPATISMLVASHASGAPAFFANIADIRGDEVLLAHCTPPLALARRYWLRRHFITRGSVTVAAELEDPGRWTITRVDSGFRRMRIAVGETVDAAPTRELQCETQLALRIPAAYRIMEDSIGNHYIAVPGDHSEALRVAGEALGLRVEVLA